MLYVSLHISTKPFRHVSIPVARRSRGDHCCTTARCRASQQPAVRLFVICPTRQENAGDNKRTGTAPHGEEQPAHGTPQATGGAATPQEGAEHGVGPLHSKIADRKKAAQVGWREIEYLRYTALLRATASCVSCAFCECAETSLREAGEDTRPCTEQDRRASSARTVLERPSIAEGRENHSGV